MRANSAACSFSLAWPFGMRGPPIRRLEKSIKVRVNTAWPESRLITDSSKVNSGAAAATTLGEMPWAIASFLNCSTQAAKLPVFWQRGAAKAGVARQAPTRPAATINAVFRMVLFALLNAETRLLPIGGRGQ